MLSYLTNHSEQANAFAAILNAVVALVGLIVASMALAVSTKTVKSQMKHNILSVRPVPLIKSDLVWDNFTIILVNYGTGPLIVHNLVIKDGNTIHKDFKEIFGKFTNQVDVYFLTELSFCVVPSGSELLLLKLTSKDGNLDYNVIINIISTVNHLVAELHYTDMYETRFPPTRFPFKGVQRTLRDEA